MTIHEALRITRRILKENGLTGWKATANKRKTAFGICNYTKREIQLSLILIPNCTDESIMDTIYHEVAHALTKGHNHDRVWRAKCIELGGNGERCGAETNYINGDNDFLIKLSKYTLTCPVCGYTAPKSRLPKRDIGCGQHGRKYNPKYKFIITQNY